MQEEKSVSSKYFKMSGSFRKQTATLFLVEELLVVGMLCGLIYLFVQ